MELLISLVVGLLVVEVYAWLPRISEKLLEWAVSRLRPEVQERYREEWRAHLNDLPNTVARLSCAVGFCTAVREINADIVAAQRTEIEDLIEGLSRDLHDGQLTLTALQLELTEQRGSHGLEHALEEALASIASIEDAHPALERLEQSFETCGLALIKAFDRNYSLLRARIERVSSKIKCAGSRLGNLSTQYEQVDTRGLSRDASAQVIRRLLDDLRGLTIAIDEIDRDEEARTFERQYGAIHTAIMDVIDRYKCGFGFAETRPREQRQT